MMWLRKWLLLLVCCSSSSQGKQFGLWRGADLDRHQSPTSQNEYNCSSSFLWILYLAFHSRHLDLDKTPEPKFMMKTRCLLEPRVLFMIGLESSQTYVVPSCPFCHTWPLLNRHHRGSTVTRLVTGATSPPGSYF
jgi:hypothetical protein